MSSAFASQIRRDRERATNLGAAANLLAGITDASAGGFGIRAQILLRERMLTVQ
jgi:hypothetical protein